MFKNIKYIFIGLIVGLGAVTPGLSGSTMLVIFGVYPLLIDVISSIRKKFRKNFLFLFCLAVGAVVGIAIGSSGIKYFTDNHEAITSFLFFGMLLGSIPAFSFEVTKQDNINHRYLLLFIFGVTIGLFILIGRFAIVPDNPFITFITGFIDGLAMILPGLDGALTLTALGLSDHFYAILANPMDYILEVIALGLGIVVSILSSIHLINYLLKRYYSELYFTIFGIFVTLIPSVLNGISVPSDMLLQVMVFFILGMLFTLFTSLSTRKEF